MTRQSAIETATRYLDDGGFEADLARLVAIPTESQVADGLPHCERYHSEEMEPLLNRLGFETETFQNPVDGCGPILLATRIEDEGLPTV
ncbi:MAG: M20 peptidase family dipeptidase, partial [Planctomycetota bacterium]